ncbi:hypothetical protein [Streptomyces benahoarensis]|uniref:Uncharacterized protein n=1 Tax=Streptomyces benahoarensis TaxID=2595054 RepID=A0A553ZMU4_9ACTN|nr:hypothetical protein [Streptomyces benahoarensis]TSB32007.1 hypothetical protein FNJ62_03770 [Streptomyces benahoarensis]TSB42733.1 hypothetical protein FNZ23_08315 [Streptomyces benahoarensis]
MISVPDSPGPSMDAIATSYGDITFRSRLEADWAATLDSNRIRWEYEPETVTLASGALYVPDFWLPELGTWIEVKGPGVPRVEKTKELARIRACRCETSCACRWPGGEFVVLGRPSLASDRTETGHRPRCGYANWETPFGPSTYFVTCSSCTRAQWTILKRPWRCRACRASLKSEQVHRPVDRFVRFIETTTGTGSLFAMPDLGEPFTDEELGLTEDAENELP